MIFLLSDDDMDNLQEPLLYAVFNVHRLDELVRWFETITLEESARHRAPYTTLTSQCGAWNVARQEHSSVDAKVLLSDSFRASYGHSDHL